MSPLPTQTTGARKRPSALGARDRLRCYGDRKRMVHRPQLCGPDRTHATSCAQPAQGLPGGEREFKIGSGFFGRLNGDGKSPKGPDTRRWPGASVAFQVRAMIRCTDDGCHWPPRGVGMPRAFNAAAMSRTFTRPAARMASITGLTFCAR